jgi:hypothetical protein
VTSVTLSKGCGYVVVCAPPDVHMRYKDIANLLLGPKLHALFVLLTPLKTATCTEQDP